MKKYAANKPGITKKGKGEPVRRCEVDITGRETPKNLSSALPRLKNDDSMTLKWSDTDDTILVTRIKNEYTVGYYSKQKNYSLESELDFSTTVEALDAFRQIDYAPEKFWVLLNSLTPIAVRREAKAVRLNPQRFVSASVDEKTFRQKFATALGIGIFFFAFVGVVWFVYDGVNAAKKTAEAVNKQAAIERTAAEDKAAMDAKTKQELEKHDAERSARPPAPTYNPVSNSEYKSVLGHIWIGTALYNKGTHLPFGFVMDADSEYVWVADSYSVGDRNVHLYAQKYRRRFITDNFETK